MGTENLPCNLNKSDQLAVNISVGADHFIRVWDGADVVDTCAEPFGPNTLPTFQGISGGLFGGMITGETVNGTFFEGRLGKGTTAKLALKQNNNYYYVDNVPLWEYIGYGKPGPPPASPTTPPAMSTSSISIPTATMFSTSSDPPDIGWCPSSSSRASRLGAAETSTSQVSGLCL